MIPNYGVVDPRISRGGQPDNAGWEWLKASGISRIVKLNLESEASDVAAAALGFTQIYEPITTAEQIVFRPEEYAGVKRAVAAIRPWTFVHCEQGQDRTGLVIGCYRVWVSGWSKQLAEAEMKEYGFHWELLGLELFWRLEV